MDARTAARILAAGRVAAGIVLMARPELIIRGWVGSAEVAEHPGVRVLGRALGIRDLVIGAITLHTLDHPQVGPRWTRTAALTDAVDFGALVAARSALPASSVVGAGARAGGATVAGFVLATKL